MYITRNQRIIIIIFSVFISFRCIGQNKSTNTYIDINKLDTKRVLQLEKRIESILINYEYINLALVQDGHIVFLASFGENRINKNDVYASVSKPVTATILLQLLNEGKIVNLDDDISKYHPRYKNAIPEEYANAVITLRQLLTHTSGVPHQSKLWDGTELRLEFQPGSDVMYSSHGYGILGDIMEEITGKSYKKLVKEYIGKPVSAESFTVRHPFFDAPAGQVASTIEDMAKFAIGVMNGTYVSKEILVNQVLKEYSRTGNEIIGIGWYCLNVNQENVAGYHAGSNGQPRAFLAIKPNQGNAVALTGKNKSEQGAHDLGALTIDLMAILENRFNDGKKK